ncbi:hypothetical protein [Pseudomonas sp. FEN]|uniref:hypothetical protein n=1 Tax=Pseudomonas sp. FEN TaxID=2767468 RepID=UPI00174C0AAF|nr:hypothetical protein [Pseudomonas sp. FEN]
MKATIVLLWLAGIVMLIAVAVYRGRKRRHSSEGPLPSDRELLDQATTELQALRAEVSYLGRKIEERQQVDSRNPRSASLKLQALGTKL